MTRDQYSDGRIVWIPREMRDSLDDPGAIFSALCDAFDAAPDDPTETVRQQIAAGPALQALCDGTGDEWLTGAVLHALGMPS